MHEVTLIPGDGTGPAICDVVKKVVAATGVQIKWEQVEAGVDIMKAAGTPLPDNVLASCRRTKVALKGPITTPIGTGFRSVNVALRNVRARRDLERAGRRVAFASERREGRLQDAPANGSLVATFRASF